MLTKLIDLGYVGTGTTPSMKNPDYYNSNDILFIKPSDINDNGVTELTDSEFFISNAARKKARIIPKNTILCVCIGSIGKIAITTKESSCNQQINYIIPSEDHNAKFLAYSLLSRKNELIRIGSDGPVVPIINKSRFENIEIIIFDYNKETEIANELDNIRNIINIKQNELNHLDELIKSRFIEMFDSERNKEKLVNLCQFINGDRGKNYPSANDRTVSGVPFINAGHLDNNTVCFEKMEYISEQKYELLSSGKVQKDDIIYCLRGSLGKKGIVTFDKGAIASSLLILRANSKIRPLFLLYSLEQEYILSQMKASNNGSSQPNLSAQSVKQYDVILPTISRQIEFEEFVKLIDKSKFVCYSKYFLWLNFTFVSSTIAYSNVVSILAWPNRCWTCSIGIPLSIAFVANVLLNLCGCTLSSPIFLPIFLSIISTPLISSLSYGFKRLTKRASLSSFLESKYCCKCIFVFASKYTFRCLLPLPKTIHSLFSKSISLISNLTSSPTLIPVDIRTSTIAKSRLLFVDCFINSIVSSEYTSFTTFPVFTLWILLHGLFEI